AAAEQFDRVHVDVTEPGDLTVTMSGTPEAGLDPRPIAGSASPGGQIADRTVTWTKAGIQPGAFDFSVQFGLGAQPGSTDSFVPQAVVTLSSSSSTLLEFAVGA